MGSRGPVPWTAGRPPKRTAEQEAKIGRRASSKATPPVAEVVALPPPAELPPVPVGLDERGVELWASVWTCAPWLSVDLDAAAVQLYCEQLAERNVLRASLAEHGATLVEPIVAPTGRVVGERLVAHPLLAPLRSLERAIDVTRERLGLSPGSRVRLGLAEAELAARAKSLRDAKLQWRKS